MAVAVNAVDAVDAVDDVAVAAKAKKEISKCIRDHDVSLQQAFHAFDENFYAYLEVTNFLGCIDSSFFSGNTLSFEDYFDINIPNVFTPNNDTVLLLHYNVIILDHYIGPIL